MVHTHSLTTYLPTYEKVDQGYKQVAAGQPLPANSRTSRLSRRAALLPGRSGGTKKRHITERHVRFRPGPVQFEIIHREQRRRWQGGERVLIESFLEGERERGLEPDREAFLDLVYNELVLREEAGEIPQCDEYIARFPRYAAELQQLFQVHRALGPGESVTAPSSASDADAATVVEPSNPLPTPAPARDWTGQLVGHYQLVQRLGAGGMGEVYLAEDRALGRTAALKLLPPDFSPGLRERLLTEAKTSARLQHPCIATFYEAGEPGGVAFIAMEYVPGQTLRERLKNGPLPVEQATGIAACLLEALGHAHALGILHRDIKPENIMLTRGSTAKLLDFGVAKELSATLRRRQAGSPSSLQIPEPEGGLLQTQAGAVVGTPGYMAPEQVAGLPLDARADLFAVGLVLYEALSGRAACKGSTLGGRLTLNRAWEPPSLDGLSVPAELKAVLRRALAPDRADRYSTAAAFLQELRQATPSAASLVPESVAVLDLENLSGNSDDEWIGVGIADCLRRSLATVPELRMVGRPTMARAQAACPASESPRAVSRLGLILGCRWVVSGEFSRTGSALRLQVCLTEVPTGEMVWTGAQEGHMDDLFTMQERLASLLAARLHVDRLAAPASAPNVNVFRSYLQGRQIWLRMEKTSLMKAQEHFEEAIRLDPEYAPALASLGGMHALRSSFSLDPAAMETASSYVGRALQADPQWAEAHVWAGYIRQVLEPEQAAVHFRSFEKAMALNPSDHLAPYFATACFARSCRRQQAAALYEELLQQPCQVDPHSWRRAEAARLLQRAVTLSPENGWSWLGLGVIHLDRGCLDAAEWSFRQALDLERRGNSVCPPGMAGWIGECLRQSGALEQARSHCLLALEAVEKTDNVYRDTLRGLFLCTLGKTALRQNDPDGAHAAFTQAVFHMRGRYQARAGGQVLVRALAGLAQAGAGAEPFEEALLLFTARHDYRFDYFHGCMDDRTLFELYRAAHTLGATEQARELFEQALDAGSIEAQLEETPSQAALAGA